MRYWKVTWTDKSGDTVFSGPLPTWTSAEMYRREIGGDATVLEY